MPVTTNQSSLKSLLALDAATCTIMGAALLLASEPIAALTQIPAPLLLWAGASLIPIAAFMAFNARATPVPGWAASLIVLGNMLWVAVSILLPAAGLIAPNPLGWVFLIGQAAVVALLAKLELGAARSPVVSA
jgi:hypothetical protein